MSDDEPEECPSCGSPVGVDGWVITTGGPKEGAVLTEDGFCQACGAPFWHDDEGENETP